MRNLIHAALIVSTALAPVAALAQTSGLDARVDRLEREMRAVQRTVFPNGAGKYVQPEITPPSVTQPSPGVPASSALADLETRLASIERQQSVLTGQVEQNQNRVRQLEDAFAAYRKATDARLSALEGGGGVAAGTGPTRPATRPVETVSSATEPTPRAPGASGAATGAGTGTAPRPGTTAAIERPASGDAAEDSYLYGYRLWEAKRYTDAQAALKETVAKYPKHRRASYAQNLLGRAYLDEGRPSLASMAFYDSFKKYPDGERAPDSLYFLGQSLMKLNKPADACKVYAELDASYGSKIGPDLKAKADKGRADAKCK